MHIKKFNKRGLAVTVCALVLAVIAAITVGVYAKYRTERQQEADIIAAGFHISSNYLDETGSAYKVSDWTGGIRIELYNFEKTNVGLITQVPIAFTYTVTKNGEAIDDFYVRYYNIENPDVSQSNLTLPENTAATYVLELTPGSNVKVEAGEKYTVLLTTTAPFAKTLTATFELIGSGEVTFSADRKDAGDVGDRYVVTVKTNGFSGTSLDLSWPDDLVPDATNKSMETWTGTTGALSVEPYTTYTLIFFNPKHLGNAPALVRTVELAE